jgi:hypothetical protein
MAATNRTARQRSDRIPVIPSRTLVENVRPGRYPDAEDPESARASRATGVRRSPPPTAPLRRDLGARHPRRRQPPPARRLSEPPRQIRPSPWEVSESSTAVRVTVSSSQSNSQRPPQRRVRRTHRIAPANCQTVFLLHDGAERAVRMAPILPQVIQEAPMRDTILAMTPGSDIRARQSPRGDPSPCGRGTGAYRLVRHHHDQPATVEGILRKALRLAIHPAGGHRSGGGDRRRRRRRRNAPRRGRSDQRFQRRRLRPFNLPDGTGAIAVAQDPAGHPIGIYSRTPLPAALSPAK